MELTKPIRTWRINIEKAEGAIPVLTAFNEQIITLDNGDVVHNQLGSSTVAFDESNPLHVTLYTALEAVVAEIR